MKDHNVEDVGATEFDLKDHQEPRGKFVAFYGSTPVPHPTNNAAKKVNGSAVMSAVLEGK
jgi:hypothetical protein